MGKIRPAVLQKKGRGSQIKHGLTMMYRCQKGKSSTGLCRKDIAQRYRLQVLCYEVDVDQLERLGENNKKGSEEYNI